MPDLSPPRELVPAAHIEWETQAARIESEGRWKAIDRDMLAAYCETTAIYLECLRAVEQQGVLVSGRTAVELVRNPACTVLHQTREAMMRLARQVPLVDRASAAESAEWDKFLESVS